MPVSYRIQKSETELTNPLSEIANSNPKSKIQNLSSTSTGDRKLEYGFKVASYDKSKELIIDPLLASTFLGGSGNDIGTSLALDASGNVYVTGNTGSTDFPTTSGAYDTSYNGGGVDVFVSRLSGDLTTLFASIYLGGDGQDYQPSVAIDSSGNIYVAGITNSGDFPTTDDAFQTSIQGYANVFISKLDNELTTLLASTFLGGGIPAVIYTHLN